MVQCTGKRTITAIMLAGSAVHAVRHCADSGNSPEDQLDMESRSASLEVRGREISGIALPWGERASVRVRGEVVQEVFTRNSFHDLEPVPLFLEHRGPEIGTVVPSDTPRGLEVAGEYSGDLGDRSHFSIEFNAHGETRSGDLRIVHDATLGGLAVLRSPAYSGAEIEGAPKAGAVASGDRPRGEGAGLPLSFGWVRQGPV